MDKQTTKIQNVGIGDFQSEFNVAVRIMLLREASSPRTGGYIIGFADLQNLYKQANFAA